MGSDQEEMRKQLQRIEVALTKVQERVALIYWICVIVVAIYVFTAAAGLFVGLSASGTNSESSSLVFPAFIVGAAVLVFFFKRRPEP